MVQSDDFVHQLAKMLDRDAAVELLRRAIGCQSITGNEANFVDLLEKEMRFLGLEAIVRKDFLANRPNIYGTRQGVGGGKRIVFIGHTDTVHVEGWREHWTGTSRENPFGAPIIDGSIWGRGAGDLKAGICSSLAALSLIDRAGIKLRGDVSFAFVGDEESGEPGTGISAGVKAYIADIESGTFARPDFVIYVEPTQLQVFTAQIGFFIADITITGKSAYFGVPEQGKDALKAAHAVMSDLWQHSAEIAARRTHDLLGSSFLLITSCSGGGFIAVPEICKLSLIRKLLPGESLDEAAAEMEQVIRGCITDPDIQIDVSYPAGRDHPLGGSATEIDISLPEVRLLPFFINQLGVPTVYCAPGDISNCHTFDEHVELEEYFAGIVAFAAFMVRYCGTVD